MTADIYVTHMFKVIYVTYMQFLITAVLHVCNIYVEIAAPSYIYVTCMYIYVTYMCGNGRYVTYMSHICRFGKGDLEQMEHLFNSERQFIDTIDEEFQPANALTSSNFKSQTKLKASAMSKVVEELQAGIANLSFNESVQYLKSNLGKWISIRDDYERTVLHLTVEKDLIRLTECLLASGAEVNALEGSGATPLLTAVLTKRCDMVQLLLKYGA